MKAKSKRNEKYMDKVLSAVKAAWLRYPHLRFGQLLFLYVQQHGIYYTEDESLVKKMCKPQLND